MAREDTHAGTVGELVKARELSPKDIEALFDGKTTLPLGESGHALVLPAWNNLTPHVREVIRSTLLLSKVVKPE